MGASGNDLELEVWIVAEPICPPRSDPRVQKILKYVEDHLGEPLGVAKLAAMVRLSPAQLRRLFRAGCGFPPHEAVRLARLRTASELLVATALEVKEVAAAVGYRSQSHFIKDFHRKYGLSPAKYAVSAPTPRS
jgi:transcriptional regulator GlxA family with amidase domain